jgi:hypothetical protein
MLNIYFLPHNKLVSMRRDERIGFILEKAHSQIIIIEGRLKSTEEAMLIRQTMNMFDEKEFSGIEIAVLHDNHELKGLQMYRQKILQWLSGKKSCITIIGPATIIQEMVQHPEMVQMRFDDSYLESLRKDSGIIES